MTAIDIRTGRSRRQVFFDPETASSDKDEGLVMFDGQLRLVFAAVNVPRVDSIARDTVD